MSGYVKQSPMELFMGESLINGMASHRKVLMLPRLNIRGKLIFSFSVLMMLVLCTLGYVVYHTFASSMHADKQSILGLHLKVMTSELQHLVGRERLSLRALEQKVANGADAESQLRKYLRGSRYAEGVLLLDSKGFVQKSLGQTAKIRNSIESGVPADIKTGLLDMSIALPSADAAELSERPLLAVAQISGIKLLRQTQTDDLPVHSMFVVYHEGRLVTSSDEPIGVALKNNFFQLMDTSPKGGDLATGVHWYGMRQSAGKLPVEVWYMVPKKVLQADVYNLKNRVFAAITVLLWISVWVVLEISHKITLPMRKLTESIGAMKEEEYTVPLAFKDSGDETAALAKSFESMRQHIDELISVDPLTNLYNRRYLMRSFEREVNRARRSHTPLCCMMLDIDFFKSINDNWGHPCGDYVLRQTARIIQENIRDCDIAARFGGEEFIVLLPMASTAEALHVGLRIGHMLEEFEFSWEGQPFHVTTSGGIAALDEIDGDEPEALIQLADAALYSAKQSGRNRVIVNRLSPRLQIRVEDYAV